jgi:hypothetical protein
MHEKAVLDTRRIEILAHQFWRARGCPEGSPDEDWFLAEEQLRHQYGFHVPSTDFAGARVRMREDWGAGAPLAR